MCAQAFNEAFQRHTEAYNRMQLYEYALDRWLELRSDTVGALVAFAVGLLALSGSLSSGTIGFLLSTGIEITVRLSFACGAQRADERTGPHSLRCVRLAVTIDRSAKSSGPHSRAINENTLNFNSAQRVFEYSSDIEQEKSSTARTHPPASWPEDGQITVRSILTARMIVDSTPAQLDNASVRYDETLPNVLKSVSVELPKRTRCGIVGATGCGKSSLTLALLRIIDAHEGGIYVDGRNLADTDIEAIRRRMTLVPQGALLALCGGAAATDKAQIRCSSLAACAIIWTLSTITKTPSCGMRSRARASIAMARSTSTVSMPKSPLAGRICLKVRLFASAVLSVRCWTFAQANDNSSVSLELSFAGPRSSFSTKQRPLSILRRMNVFNAPSRNNSPMLRCSSSLIDSIPSSR